MRACRECGCTDEQGCEGGCVWAEADLCSSCHGRTLANHELIRAGLAVDLPLVVWLAVHGNLLLALRHPENVGSSRSMVEDVVAMLEGTFLDSGFLTEEQVAMMHAQEEAARPRIIIPGG